MTCKCHKCLGPDGKMLVEVREGAVAALEFLCAHNRHSTYIEGKRKNLDPEP